MFTSEKRAKRTVMAALKDYAPMALENEATRGAADIICSLGCLEIKRLKAWPKHADAVVRVPHWTPQQKAWHSIQSRAGMSTFVLVFCEEDVLLLEGVDAVRCLGYVCKARLLSVAVAFWTDVSWKFDLAKVMHVRPLEGI